MTMIGWRSARALGLVSLMFGASAGCSLSTASPESEDGAATQLRQPMSAASGVTPVVGVLTQLPGPQLPEGQQWVTADQNVQQEIPDDSTPGLNSELVTSDIDGGKCSSLLDAAVVLAVEHPRVADLYITLSRIGPTGTVLQTTILFDGPSEARRRGSDKLELGDWLSAGAFLGQDDCSRMRLNVADFRQGEVGTLRSWKLERRVAWAPFTQGHDYYEKLLFGGVTPNVNGYFSEVSRFRFGIRSAGIYGPLPIAFKPSDGADDSARARSAILALDGAGFDFGAYDADHDGDVDAQELLIVDFENTSQYGGGATRHDGECTPVASGLDVCSSVSLVTLEPTFSLLTHEMAHQLGTQDLYGSASRSEGLTLMSSSYAEGGPKHEKSVYLDPMHRQFLGWVQPIAMSDVGGCVELGDETYVDAFGARARPQLLAKPGSTSEYYLFEYRTPRTYDSWLPRSGVVAWHVMTDGANEPYEVYGVTPYGDFTYAVGPDRKDGASLPWIPSDGRFRLHWQDGTMLPYSFWVSESSTPDHSAFLNSEAAPARQPTIRITAPSSGTVDLTGSHATNFVASVADGAGGAQGLTVQWSSNLDGSLGTSASASYVFRSVGKRTITATVRDVYGGQAQDKIELDVKDSVPTVRIDAPTSGAHFVSGTDVTFAGTASTATLLAIPCSELRWQIDRLPGWTKTGCNVSEKLDFLGDAVVTLRAKHAGRIATTTAKFSLDRPAKSQPPVPRIGGPADNTPLYAETTYLFIGDATLFNGATASSFRWTVWDGERETPIGDDRWFLSWRPKDQIRFDSRTVELRLYATDSRGLTGMIAHRHFIIQRV